MAPPHSSFTSILRCTLGGAPKGLYQLSHSAFWPSAEAVRQRQLFPHPTVTEADGNPLPHGHSWANCLTTWTVSHFLQHLGSTPHFLQMWEITPTPRLPGQKTLHFPLVFQIPLTLCELLQYQFSFVIILCHVFLCTPELGVTFQSLSQHGSGLEFITATASGAPESMHCGLIPSEQLA